MLAVFASLKDVPVLYGNFILKKKINFIINLQLLRDFVNIICFTLAKSQVLLGKFSDCNLEMLA